MTTQPFAIPALLLLIAGALLAVGVVPRNRFFGFRIRKTLSDDRIWYPVNRFAGVAVIIASGLYGAVAIIWPYDRLASDDLAKWGLHLAGFVVPIVVGLSLTMWYAKRRSS